MGKSETKKSDEIIVASARQQLKIDRVEAAPFKSHPALKAAASALIILALYIYSWGDGIETAVKVLVSNAAIPLVILVDAHTPKLLHIITERIVVIALALGLFLALRTKPTRKPSFTNGAKAFGMAYLVINFGMAAMLGVGSLLDFIGLHANEYPHPTVEAGAYAQALYILDGTLAGPAEELIMTALVVVLMRKLNIGWTPIILVAIALRIPFHLYYGWAALALSLWVIATILLYRRTNRILPIILAHSAKNLIAGLGAFGILPMPITIGIVLMIFGISIYAVLQFLKNEHHAAPQSS